MTPSSVPPLTSLLPSSSPPVSPLLLRGVTEGVFVLAPSSAETFLDEDVEEEEEGEVLLTSSPDSVRPTPSLDPAGRPTNSSTSTYNRIHRNKGGQK